MNDQRLAALVLMALSADLNGDERYEQVDNHAEPQERHEQAYVLADCRAGGDEHWVVFPVELRL